MTPLIVLAGSPNCGKTTLFNRLTGSRQHAANWPGVTVEVKTGALHPRYHAHARVADLPGVYSLHPQSAEERAARSFLLQSRPDVLVQVVDASVLERGLRLTQQLLALGRPMMVALNMMDEARRLGITFDLPKLQKKLGVPVVPICARSGEGLQALVRCALSHPAPPTAASFDAAQLAAACCRQPLRPPPSLTDRIDRVLMHPVWSLPLFAALMLAVFFLAFGPFGSWIAGLFAALVDACSGWLCTRLQACGLQGMLYSLLADGVILGVGSVLRFLPTLLVLFFLLSLLEDSGYMARMAFLMDRPLKKIGLSGRSFIPLMLGFGCTVPAVMSARSLAGRRERVCTILLTPLMSCGAKLPVYALFARAFFPGHALGMVCALYLAGALLAIPCGLLLKQLVCRGEPAGFVMELPPYRMPALQTALRLMADKARDFLSRAFGMILLCTVVVWFLQSVTPALTAASSFSQSLLGLAASACAPWLAPAGFGTPQAAAALFSGLLAKESVVSTLAILAPDALQMLFPSALGAFSFLLFVLLYAPCCAALAAIRREAGTGWMLACAMGQTGLAWCVSTLVYQLGIFFD